MKCVKCIKDSPLKDRTSGNCQHCGHPFVCDPSRHSGLTDMAIENSVTACSSDGSFFFLDEHVVWELHRRLCRGRSLRNIAGFVFLVVTLGVAIGAFALGARGFEILLPAGVFAGFALFFLMGGRRSPGLPGLRELVSKFLKYNKNPKRVVPGSGSLAPAAEARPDLAGVSFERVVVCDRPEYVDFLLANQFHFHYACPVLGDHYPKGIFEDMIKRFRSSPNVVVYMVHDLTPAGYEFVRKVRQDPAWFGGNDETQIVDGGITPRQQRGYRRLLVPLADIPHSLRGHDLAGVPPGMGVALAALRPEQLIRELGQGVATAEPLDAVVAGTIYDAGYG